MDDSKGSNHYSMMRVKKQTSTSDMLYNVSGKPCLAQGIKSKKTSLQLIRKDNSETFS